MFSSFYKTCRTCLKVDADVVSVYDFSLYFCPKVTYAEILQDIARLEFKEEQSSNMPQQLCSGCCRHLRKAYTFVKQVRESEEELSKMLETQIEPVTELPNLGICTQMGLKLEDCKEFQYKDCIGTESNTNLDIVPKSHILDETLDKSKLFELENTPTDQADDILEKDSCFHEDSKNNYALRNNIAEEYNVSEEDVGNLSLNAIHMKAAHFVEATENISHAESIGENEKETKYTVEASRSDDEREFLSIKDPSEESNHSQQSNKKSLPYKCEHCPRQYSNKYDLRYHLIYKHKIDYKSNLSSKHKHRPAQKIIIQCRSCEYTANSHAALHYHTRSKHGTDEHKIKCKFCPYTNVKKFSLFAHLKKFHLSKIKALKKCKKKQNETGDTLCLEEHSGMALENVSDTGSSECSSGDEDIIREILTIKKRAPKSLMSESEDSLNNREDMKNNAPNLESTNCSLCSLDVGSQENMIIHMKTHHGKDCLFDCNEETKPTPKKQLFSCDQCQRKYADKKKFKIHIKNKHGIDFKEFLKKQQKLPTDPKIYKCKFCEYTGNSAAAVHFHMLSKHGKEEDKIKCIFCSYTNFKKFSLLTHIKNSHLPIVKRLKTQRNSGNESLKDVLTLIPAMLKSTEDPDTKAYGACSSGDEDFIRDILKMKKRGGRTNIAKTYAIRCDECGNVYKDTHALKVHKRNVHGEHSYHPCPQCHRKYKRSYDLKLHILQAHTPNYVDPKKRSKVREKRFMCTECSYVCTTSTLLTIHTNRHHTGEKPYKCNVCSKSFVIPFDLKTHSYLHTGETPFKCPICSKGFRDKSHMLKHKRIHSEVKPFNCSECGKGFTKNYNLTIHMRTHMKGIKLNCTVCGKFFKDRAQLSIHQINEFHHGEAV